MRIKFGNHFDMSIHKDGRLIVSFLAFLAFVSLAASGLLHGMTLVFAMIAALVGMFFRDPERVAPDGENIVLSPGDGKIISIEKTMIPEELNITELKDQKYWRISIFISITDVHVQRIPVNGVIKFINYFNGAFINPSFDKASKENERNYITIQNQQQDLIVVSQIAGFIARRIVCDIKEGDEVKIGSRYGIIKLGSRVELYLPENYNINVRVGQTMLAGETIIATF